MTRIRPNKDTERQLVLNWLIDKMYDVFKMLNEKQFSVILNNSYMIAMVCKTFKDLNLTYNAFTLLGVILLHTGLYMQAKQVFEVVKDIAMDSHNWSQVMVAYEFIGRAYQELQDYENSTFTFKLMLQYAWIT